MTPSRGSIDEGFWEVVRWVRKYVWKYSEEMWHHVEIGLDDGWSVISEFYLKSYGFIKNRALFDFKSEPIFCGMPISSKFSKIS